MEFVKRAKLAFGNFQMGKYDKIDLAIYQIHLQSTVFKFTSALKQAAAKAMKDRLEVKYGEPTGLRPSMNFDDLPEELKVLAEGAYKIEYMIEGTYNVAASQWYKDLVLEDVETNKIAIKHKISPKFVDTMCMSNYDIMGMMWCESLYRPSVIIKINTCIFCTGMKPEKAVIRMMTYVFDYNNLITITKIN